MNHSKLIVSVLLCGATLVLPCCSCSSVHEARRMVAVADSLRVNEGVTCDDSLALAEAYDTFGRWRLIYPNDHARACYYYGRMLRQRGDQVGAMQAFISGSHAPYVQRVVPLLWFNDYHILGRIYSNMGSMCHLVDEFELSYDMYENAAKQIIKTNDSTSYYYLLNDMAVELAELKLHGETRALLDSIERNCTNDGVLTKLWETKAILHFNLEQYDSVIYSAKQLYRCGYRGTIGYEKEAQAFWYLQQYDSALYYANIVLNLPHASAQERYNMMFISAYNDDTIDADEVKRRSEEREDIDKEELDPQHIQLAHAIHLLQQDIKNRRPYLTLGLFVLSICVIVCIIWLYTDIKRHRNMLQNDRLKIHEESMACTELTEQNLEHICNLWKEKSINLRQILDIDNYDNFCRIVNAHCFNLVDKLNSIAKLSQTEMKLCVLVFIGLDNTQIQKIIPYSANGYGKLKYTASRKIGTTSKEMRLFMLNMLIK